MNPDVDLNRILHALESTERPPLAAASFDNLLFLIRQEADRLGIKKGQQTGRKADP